MTENEGIAPKYLERLFSDRYAVRILLWLDEHRMGSPVEIARELDTIPADVRMGLAVLDGLDLITIGDICGEPCVMLSRKGSHVTAVFRQIEEAMG